MPFFPDVRLGDFKTPLQIMSEAATELATSTELKVDVLESIVESRKVLHFQIRNDAADLTVRLFHVVHEVDSPYPAALRPPEDTTPDYLKKRRWQPGINATVDAIRVFQGRWVENEWVASNPSEFREKLEEVCLLNQITNKILAAQAAPPIQAEKSPPGEVESDSSGQK